MEYTTLLALVIGGGSVLVTLLIFLTRFLFAVGKSKSRQQREPRLL